MMKDEIIKKLEDLIKEDISEETFVKAEDIKNEYVLACQHVEHEVHVAEMAGGEHPETSLPAKDPLDGRFNELIHILDDRERKFKKLKHEEIASKLQAKQTIIDELQKLISEETNIGKAFHNFKELQQRWTEIGNIPSHNYKNLQAAYHRHIHNFYYNMKLSKDLRELDFKRNLEFRLQLLSKIESLLQMESIKGMERLLTLYRMEWSELGPTSMEKTEELRNRYRELIGIALQKIRDFHQEKIKHEQHNLEAKKNLLERVVKMSEEQFETPKQWQTMADTINRIVDEWKKIGYAPKGDNEQIWTEFKKALNTFHQNRRNYFGELKKVHKDNKEKKLELIKKAEELSSASYEVWDDATNKLIQLQKQWKDVGHVDSWDETKLWKKFRENCDKFFGAKRDFFADRDKDQIVNLQKKEELIKKLEAFTPTGNAEDDLKSLKEFSTEWKEIPHVPFKDKQRIHDQYKKVLDAKYDSLKLDSANLHLMRFKSNIDLLSHGDDSSHLLRKEKSLLQDKMKKLQATINQYENNLGFFTNSKNMGSLLKEVEANLSRAHSEMELLKKKMSLFNEHK